MTNKEIEALNKGLVYWVYVNGSLFFKGDSTLWLSVVGHDSTMTRILAEALDFGSIAMKKTNG